MNPVTVSTHKPVGHPLPHPAAMLVVAAQGMYTIRRRIPIDRTGMSSVRHAMRRVLIAAALSAALLATADAKEQRGTIISVDDAAKTFVCQVGHQGLDLQDHEKDRHSHQQQGRQLVRPQDRAGQCRLSHGRRGPGRGLSRHPAVNECRRAVLNRARIDPDPFSALGVEGRWHEEARVHEGNRPKS